MRLKTILTGTAVSAVAPFMFAGVANAAEIVPVPGPANLVTVYGNGASLPSPYWRQAADCFSVKTDLIFSGTPPTTATIADFAYTGEPSQNCATTNYTSNRKLDYMSTGSGLGIQAFFSHSPAVAGDTSPAEGTQLFPSINYALSETSLGATEVNAYNNGGTVQTITVVAPGATPGAGQYPNPAYNYGAMIQFPVLIAPVTIAYDPVYKKVRQGDGSIVEYSFNNVYERADETGGFHFNKTLVCGVFNGDFINWNHIEFQKANQNTSLRASGDTATFAVPLQLVGRRDSSGTTSLWTRYLANVCASHPGNSYGNSTSRLPGVYKEGSSTRTTATLNKDLVGAVWDKSSDNFGAGRVFVNPADNQAEAPGRYTVADGNDGVAKYIDFTQEPTAVAGNTVKQGRIGYLGPDYVLPGVLFTGQNTYALKTADVKNQFGNFIAPTSASVAAAFAGLRPPESDGNGAYVANATCGTGSESGKCRKNPQDWVEPADKSSPLANPVAAGAYPIVGTSNFLGYSCYANAGRKENLLVFFKGYYLSSKTINDGSLGLLSSSGFAPIPATWRKAIKETLFDNVNALNLNMSNIGGHAKCSAGAFGPRIGG